MTDTPAVDIRDIARRINLEIFGAGRLETIDELYAPDLAIGVRKLVGMMRTAFPDLTVEIEHVIAEGDKVACRWSARGTQENWFHGIPPTRAEVSWTGTSIYMVENGRVVENTSNWDVFGLLQQLRAALNQ